MSYPDVEEIAPCADPCQLCANPDTSKWRCNKCGLTWHCGDWQPCSFCDEGLGSPEEMEFWKDFEGGE